MTKMTTMTTIRIWWKEINPPVERGGKLLTGFVTASGLNEEALEEANAKKIRVVMEQVALDHQERLVEI